MPWNAKSCLTRNCMRCNIASMKLDQYLTLHDLTEAAFAEEIGVVPSTVWRMRRGETRPDWKTLEAIKHATSGAVTPNDFLEMPQPSEAPVQ
jgi:transcriptional regulator with XRE-family HTH domain